MKHKKLPVLGGLAFGLALLMVWLWYVDPVAVFKHWLHLKPAWVAAAGGLYMLAYFLRSYRWRLLLKPVAPVKLGQAFGWWMAGNFLNYLVPIRAGEVMRAWLVKRAYGPGLGKTLPSVFVDKLFDTAGIVVVLILLPFLRVKLAQPLLWLIMVLAIIAAIGAFVLVLAAHSPHRLAIVGKKVFFFIPQRFKDRFFDFIEHFSVGTGLFKQNKGLIIPVSFFTLAAVAADSLFFWCMFNAFNVQVNYLAVLFGYTLIYLSYILPHPPAQIGSNELIMVLIFSVGFGYKADLTGAIMVFSHLLTGVLLTASGLVAISAAGVTLAESFGQKPITVTDDNDAN